MSASFAIPAPRRLAFAEKFGFAAMVVGMFMAILDIQIVSASLTDIQAGLAAAPDEASWIQTSYLMAEIVMIPLSGYLSRAMGTRLLFCLSCAGFVLFSVSCAFAESLEAMILARAAQGFVGGAMIPTAFATSFLLFPGAARIKVGVLMSLTATMAPTIGPSLGGWLTANLSWHWLFLVNVPVGIVVGSTVWFTLDMDKPEPGLWRRLDWWGLLFMAVFLGSLEYVMEEGPRWQWFEDAGVREFALLGLVTGGLFLWRAFTSPEPIVELRAFRNRTFMLGCLASLVMGVGLYGLVYVLPLFLSQVRLYNAYQIGETLFITGACMLVAAPIAGRVARLMDLRLMLALGLGTFALSSWWLASLTATSGFWEMAGPLGLRGVGLIFSFMPINQITLGTLPPPMIKNASALYNLMRNTGGALGLAAINTLLVWRSAAHRTYLIEQVNWGRPNVQPWLDNMSQRIGSLRPDLPADTAALRRAMAMVQREALVLAYNDVLMAMAALFIAAIPLVLLMKKPQMANAGGGH